MRYESIDTTMRYYVGRSAQATADVVWEAYNKAVDQPKMEKSQERDTSRDSDQIPPSQSEDLKDASQRKD
jgi:hypothetical protein